MNCSFCDRNQRLIQHLVIHGQVAICNECVGRAAKMCGLHVGPPISAGAVRQIPEVAWADVVPDVAEVIAYWLVDDVEMIANGIRKASARGLAAQAARLTCRKQNLHSALRKLGFAEQIREPGNSDDYLDTLLHFDELDRESREFVYKMLLQRIPDRLQDANANFDHGLEIDGARMLAVAAASRAAAVELGWDSGSFALAG